jgi:hypothetical protein
LNYIWRGSAQMEQLELLLDKLKELDSEMEIVVSQENEININSKTLGFEHCFDTCSDEDINDLKNEINTFIKTKNMTIKLDQHKLKLDRLYRHPIIC